MGINLYPPLKRSGGVITQRVAADPTQLFGSGVTSSAVEGAATGLVFAAEGDSSVTPPLTGQLPTTAVIRNDGAAGELGVALVTLGGPNTIDMIGQKRVLTETATLAADTMTFTTDLRTVGCSGTGSDVFIINTGNDAGIYQLSSLDVTGLIATVTFLGGGSPTFTDPNASVDVSVGVVSFGHGIADRALECTSLSTWTSHCFSVRSFGTGAGMNLSHTNTSATSPAINIINSSGQDTLVVNTNALVLDTGGRLGLGQATPDASSILDMTSTTAGFLPPRMTTVNRDNIGSPATGLTIYNTDTNDIEFYNGASWGGTVGGGTLDDAYDFGGAGAGRTIDADSGAVEITVSDTDNNVGFIVNQNDTTNNPDALQITNTGTGFSLYAASTDPGRIARFSSLGGSEKYTGTGLNAGVKVAYDGTLTANQFPTGFAIEVTPTSPDIGTTFLTIGNPQTIDYFGFKEMIASESVTLNPGGADPDGIVFTTNIHTLDVVEGQGLDFIILEGTSGGTNDGIWQVVSVDVAGTTVQVVDILTGPATFAADDTATARYLTIKQTIGGGVGTGSNTNVDIVNGQITTQTALGVRSWSGAGANDIFQVRAENSAYNGNVAFIDDIAGISGLMLGIRTNAGGSAGGLQIDQNADAQALQVDSEATSANAIGVTSQAVGAARAMLVQQEGTGGGIRIQPEATMANSVGALEVVSSVAHTNSSNLLLLSEQNASSTHTVFNLINNGGGTCMNISNTSGGTGINIDQNADASSIVIDSEATTATVLNVDVVNTSGEAVKFVNNGALTSGNNLLDVTQAGGGAGDVVEINNNGTGQALRINQTGDTGNVPGTDGAFYLDNTANPGIGLNVYTAEDGASDGPLAHFMADNAAFDQNVIRVLNDGAGNAIDIETRGTGKGLVITNSGSDYSIQVGTEDFIIDSSGRVSVGELQSVLLFGAEVTTGDSDIACGRFAITDAAKTGSALVVVQDGSGHGINLDINGTSAASRYGLYVNNKAAAQTNTALVYIEDDQASSQPMVYIDGELGHTGKALQIDFDAAGGNPVIDVNIADQAGSAYSIIDIDQTTAGNGAVTGLDMNLSMNDAADGVGIDLTLANSGAGGIKGLLSNAPVEITIADAANEVGMTVTQNDVTNDPDAISVVNAGTGTAVAIDNNDIGDSINIDADANSASDMVGVRMSIVNASTGDEFAFRFDGNEVVNAAVGGSQDYKIRISIGGTDYFIPCHTA